MSSGRRAVVATAAVRPPRPVAARLPPRLQGPFDRVPLLRTVPWTLVVALALGGGGGVLAWVGAGPLPGLAVLAVTAAVGAADRWAAAVEARTVGALEARAAVRSRVVADDDGSRGGSGDPGGGSGDVDRAGAGHPERSLTAEEIAEGAVLALRPGDVLAVAATVRSVDGLHVDDFALAGDAPAPRRVAVGDQLAPGTLVLRGTGRAVASAARAGDPVPGAPPRRSARRRDAVRLVAATAWTAPVLAAGIAALGVASGAGPQAAAQAAGAVLVAAAGVATAARAVPGVVARATARLAAAGSVARAPWVLDRLASVDLVAVGTAAVLRDERPDVVQVWTAGGDASDLARAAVLGPGEGDEAVDRALLAWARSLGIEREHEQPAAPLVAEVPWDAGRRRVTTAHAQPGGSVLVIAKGAPQALWPLLVTSADGVSAAVATARPVVERWVAQGLRVVAVATTRRTVAGNAAGRLEWGLRLLGLVGVSAGARPGTAEAVTALRGAGVDVAVLSGDDEAEALGLARAAGVAGPDRGAGVVTGVTLATGRWADDVRVLAGLTPDQHRDAVARWQASGHVVALTGRSVPEIPALRRADVGVCLGPADEAARAAAALRCGSPDLADLVPAVLVARRVHAGIRLVLGSGAAVAVAVCAVVLAGLLAVPGRSGGGPAAQSAAAWVTPWGAAVLTPLAVVVAALLAVAASRVPAGVPLPAAGRRPAARGIDSWWLAGVLARGVGVALVAVLAAVLCAAAGVGAAPVAGVALGVLAGGAWGVVLGDGRLVGAGAGAPAALAVAVCLLGLAVLAAGAGLAAGSAVVVVVTAAAGVTAAAAGVSAVTLVARHGGASLPPISRARRSATSPTSP